MSALQQGSASKDLEQRVSALNKELRSKESQLSQRIKGAERDLNGLVEGDDEDVDALVEMRTDLSAVYIGAIKGKVEVLEQITSNLGAPSPAATA